MAIIQNYDIDISAIQSKLAALKKQLDGLKGKGVTLGVDTAAIDEAVKELDKLSAGGVKVADNLKPAAAVLEEVAKTATAAAGAADAMITAQGAVGASDISAKLKAVDEAYKGVAVSEEEAAAAAKAMGDAAKNVGASQRDATIAAKALAKVEREELNAAIKEQALIIKASRGSLDEQKQTYNDIANQIALLGRTIKSTPLDSPELKGLENEYKALNDRLKEIDASMGNYQRNVGNYTNSFIEGSVPMRTAIKQMTEELARMELQGKGNSEEYMKLGIELGNLQDKMNRARFVAKDYASDTRVLANSFEFVKLGVDAYSAVQNSMVAFGIQNESLQRTMQRLMAVQGALNAIQRINIQLTDNASVVYRTIVKVKQMFTKSTQIQTTAMGAEAAATTTATTATKAFRAALISTGIGAFIVAIGALVAYWDKIVGFFGGATKAMKQFNSEVGRSNTLLTAYLSRLEVWEKVTGQATTAADKFRALHKSLNTEMRNVLTTFGLWDVSTGNFTSNAARLADGVANLEQELSKLSDKSKLSDVEKLRKSTLEQASDFATELVSSYELSNDERESALKEQETTNKAAAASAAKANEEKAKADKERITNLKNINATIAQLQKEQTKNSLDTVQKYSKTEEQLAEERLQKQKDNLKQALTLTADNNAELLNEQKNYLVQTTKIADESATNASLYTIGQMQDEKQASEDAKKAEEEKMQGRIASIGAVGDALGALGGLIGEENEVFKAVMIGQTVSETISGAMGAFSQAVKSLPPPFGAITGAAAAAAVTLKGAAAIKNITSAKKNVPNMDGSMPTANTPSVSDTLTGAYYANAILSDQRVVVVASDIETRLQDRRVIVD